MLVDKLETLIGWFIYEILYKLQEEANIKDEHGVSYYNSAFNLHLGEIYFTNYMLNKFIVWKNTYISLEHSTCKIYDNVVTMTNKDALSNFMV